MLCEQLLGSVQRRGTLRGTALRSGELVGGRSSVSGIPVADWAASMRIFPCSTRRMARSLFALLFALIARPSLSLYIYNAKNDATNKLFAGYLRGEHGNHPSVNIQSRGAEILDADLVVARGEICGRAQGQLVRSVHGQISRDYAGIGIVSTGAKFDDK